MPASIQTIEIDADTVRHTRLDDAQGLAVGILLCSLGLSILGHLGLMTGQIAGLALILSYLSGLSFGVAFFVLNLPFYLLSWTRLGPRFTLRTAGCVTALSVVAELVPGWMQLGQVDPFFGAVVFGTTTGLGLLAIFRHGASLGGLGIVALMVQDRTGFRAGHVQMIFDVAIFLLAFFLFPASIVAYSLIGAVVLNGIVAFNHRRDRYIAS